MVDRTSRPIVPTEHADEREHRRLLAVRASASLPKDGTEGMAAPLSLMSYTVANLPTASLNTGAVAYASDLGTLVFSDGSTWQQLPPTPGYQQGLWVPTLITTGVPFTGVTYDPLTGGRYVRIGNLVHVQGIIRTDSVTVGAATGSIAVAGLPFSCVTNSTGTNDADASGAIGFATGWAGNRPLHCNFLSGITSIALSTRATVNGNDIDVVVADVGTGANQNTVYFSGTYIAA